MYLNTGSGKYLRSSRILGIFDMDTATVCVATRRFLSKMQKEGCVRDADGEIPKSFLLVDEEGKDTGVSKRRKKEKKKKQVILCKFSSGVLLGRLFSAVGEDEEEGTGKEKPSERE